MPASAPATPVRHATASSELGPASRSARTESTAGSDTVVPVRNCVAPSVAVRTMKRSLSKSVHAAVIRPSTLRTSLTARSLTYWPVARVGTLPRRWAEWKWWLAPAAFAAASIVAADSGVPSSTSCASHATAAPRFDVRTPEIARTGSPGLPSRSVA